MRSHEGHDPMIPSGAHMVETDGLQHQRLPRPTLFMGIAALYAKRGTCRRAAVGVTATREGRVMAAGYVGAPSGLPHCLEEGCIMENGGCVRSVHAEANMIAWCAREGISLRDTTLWATHAPCYNCAKLIANLGIAQFVYKSAYRDNRGVDLLLNLDIPILPIGLVSES